MERLRAEKTQREAKVRRMRDGLKNERSQLIMDDNDKFDISPTWLPPSSSIHIIDGA